MARLGAMGAQPRIHSLGPLGNNIKRIPDLCINSCLGVLWFLFDVSFSL